MILPAFLFSSDLVKEHAPGSLWPKENEETHGAELNTTHSLEPSPAKLTEISWTQADPYIHGQERNACYFSDIEV